MAAKAKILVIDDDFLVLRTLGRVLDACGYEATAVDSGMKAIDLVKKHDFDLVMSDIRMPELDGVETVKIIEEHYKSHGKNCAFMFITAYPDDRRAEDAKKLSRDRFMVKPFEIDELLKMIEMELQERPSL